MMLQYEYGLPTVVRSAWRTAGGKLHGVLRLRSGFSDSVLF
jgi:hypothetical protein